MATFEKRKDRDGNVITVRVKIRRKGYPLTTRNFDVVGGKKINLGHAMRQAEMWARQIESEIDRGAFISRAESEQTTFGECLDLYVKEVVPLKKGASRERSKIATIARYPIAALYMVSIRGADVAAYRDARLKVVKAATVQRELAVISHVFTTARREWRMENLSNPVEVVRKPKLPKGRDRRLKANELDDILRASESEELGRVVQLVLETAMRRGEISTLRWENIDLKNKSILLRDTKNGDTRPVPLSSRAIKLLKALPRRIDGGVFGMLPDSITRAFDRACQRAGVEHLRFHDLRHEATSRLFEKGLNPMEVASITGHKTLQMLKRYTHLKVEDLARKLG